MFKKSRTQRSKLREIKAHLPRYLENDHGILDIKNPFFCLNPANKCKNLSMAYSEKTYRIKCVSCNASYDIIDLIKQDYNLNGWDALERAAMFVQVVREDEPKGAQDAKYKKSNGLQMDEI